jgi:hypothetical protein
MTNPTKTIRLVDLTGTSDGQVAERLRLKRAASGTKVLQLRRVLADEKPGTARYREVLELLTAARSLAALGNSTIQVPVKGGLAG